MSRATGQITITDFNDAVTLTGYIGCNHPKTQQYNPDTDQYTPSWDTHTSPAGVELILTPSLYKVGSNTNIISNVTDGANSVITKIVWYDQSNPTTPIPFENGTNYTSTTWSASVPSSGNLIIKTNILASITGKDFVCEITYKDPTIGDITYKTSISFNRVVNGGGIADAVAWCPDGNIFKNGGVPSLTAKCELWKGSIVDETASYQWFVQNPSIKATSGTLYDSAAGIGWEKLSESKEGVSNVTTNTLTVSDGFVPNMSVFKCKVSDTGTGSGLIYWDSVTMVDQSDSIQVTISSSAGNVFKNGIGSTILEARIFRAGEEITGIIDGATIWWYKFDQNGAMDANYGGAGIDHKIGKTMAVGGADVKVKATFRIDLQ